jgi:hypothetical protein
MMILQSNGKVKLHNGYKLSDIGISLALFKKLDLPHEGAIEALNSLIGELKATKN